MRIASTLLAVGAAVLFSLCATAPLLAATSSPADDQYGTQPVLTPTTPSTPTSPPQAPVQIAPAQPSPSLGPPSTPSAPAGQPFTPPSVHAAQPAPAPAAQPTPAPAAQPTPAPAAAQTAPASAAAQAPAASQSPSPTLPFTGLSLVHVVLAGIGLIVLGLLLQLQRPSTRRTP